MVAQVWSEEFESSDSVRTARQAPAFHACLRAERTETPVCKVAGFSSPRNPAVGSTATTARQLFEYSQAVAVAVKLFLQFTVSQL